MRAGLFNPVLFPGLTEDPWEEATVGSRVSSDLVSVEICAGAGGQALGYEQAGIGHSALVEIDPHACATLRLNRPSWNVIEADLREFDGKRFKGIDILCGGLPCPPFSVAGKQLGEKDERNLFPAMLRLADQIRPKAVMVENVRGILDPAFRTFRSDFALQLERLGYQTGWRLLQAADFGVSQLRPRAIFVALKEKFASDFYWPSPSGISAGTVGNLLLPLMRANGWKKANDWSARAQRIAPTIVGGSHKHGGPDLGPTRARKAWAELGVDGLGIANEAPTFDFDGLPRLTLQMVAALQGFPPDWKFSGGKTAQYRQIGNAFPPPLARAVAQNLSSCLQKERSVRVAV